MLVKHLVSHKVAALDRLLYCFGAYLSHLTMLIDDPKTKPVDQQKLKGYLLKWCDAKMILGSAYFCDFLKAIFNFVRFYRKIRVW